MTYEEFIKEFEPFYQRNKSVVRKGQAYVNFLHMLRQDLYDRIPENIDPYYVDAKLPAFLRWVVAEWDKKS